MKKYKWYLLIVGGLVIVFIGLWLWVNCGKTVDFRTAKIDENGIELQSLSFKRKMVAKVKVGKDTKLWIPEGYGWYRSGSIKKLLDDEKKAYLLDSVLFYNFGFDSDLWLDGRGDGGKILNEWGWWPWIKYKVESPNWLFKDDELSQDSIDRLMVRDMADSDILESKMRITIYNASAENGLAAFVGTNLERLGFTVTGWETADKEEIVCKIAVNPKIDKSLEAIVIKKHLNKCEVLIDEKLAENEVEIYFGEKFAQMINYRSYVGTF